MTNTDNARLVIEAAELTTKLLPTGSPEQKSWLAFISLLKDLADKYDVKTDG